ncbi:hypothetical protein KM043_008216 [Ampulex compressa]|nr:hypothetical protein KM043_008216 [Ampulex compressa]
MAQQNAAVPSKQQPLCQRSRRSLVIVPPPIRRACTSGRTKGISSVSFQSRSLLSRASRKKDIRFTERSRFTIVRPCASRLLLYRRLVSSTAERTEFGGLSAQRRRLDLRGSALRNGDANTDLPDTVFLSKEPFTHSPILRRTSREFQT